MAKRAPQIPRIHPKDESKALTSKEVELLRLAAKGFDGVEAGRMVGLSHDTTKNYYSIIFRKLQAANKCEAVYRAVKEGIIE